MTGAEINKIKNRLDKDESVVLSTTQSRVRVGGAAIITPNTIFVTEKRVIIRNPTRLGFGEKIEEYFYHQITNIKLENGLFSSSLLFSIEGMTEISKSDRSTTLWGRSVNGVIDAIPKKIAEKIYEYVRVKIREEKDNHDNTTEEPMKILKSRYAKGEISKEEFKEMKAELE